MGLPRALALKRETALQQGCVHGERMHHESLHVAELESIVDAQQNELLYEAWPAAKKRWYWQGGMHEILQEPFRQGVVAAMLEDIRG